MLMAMMLISLKWFLICCVSCLTLLILGKAVKILELQHSYPIAIHNFAGRWSVHMGIASGLICMISTMLLLISWIP